MNIVDATKKTIVQEVLRFGSTKSEWRIFVYHEPTALLLSNLFSISNILDHEILLIQRLEAVRKPVKYSALYFLEMNSNSFSDLKKDIKQKKYAFYYIVTTNRTTYSKKLDSFENVQHKECLLSFFPLEERLFTFNRKNLEDAILSVSNIAEKSFVIHYKERNRKTAESLSTKLRDTDQKGDLVLLDRSIDICIPLIHYFTFQSILKDLNLDDFEKDDELWPKIRHVHMAEINKILSRESRKIISDIKTLENKDVDQKTLMQMVMQAPEKIKLKESLGIYLDLVDKVFDFYENDIKSVVNIEQSVSTKLLPNGYKYTTPVKDAMDLFLKETITKENKMRVLLLCGSQYEFQKNELEVLINKGVFTKSDIKLIEEVKKFHFQTSKRKNKYKYDISRYVPVLHSVISDLLADRSEMCSIGHKNKVSLSLRRSNFAFSSNKSKQLICVVFTDTVTWPEVQMVYELSKVHNVDVIIGAPQVVTASEFIENLKAGYFS